MGYLEKNNIKAVLFDIDGTLYPKYQMNAYLFFSALKAPIFSLRYNGMRRKMRAHDKMKEGKVLTQNAFRGKEFAFIYKSKDPFKLDKYLKKYQKTRTTWERTAPTFIVPFSSMFKTMKRLKDSGYLLGALSDFPLGKKLEVLGIAPLCDFKASCEDFGYLKPNPIPFREMLNKLSLKPEEAIYIGDSYSKDIVGAKNVGMHTAFLTHKHDNYKDADITFSAWSELARKLF